MEESLFISLSMKQSGQNAHEGKNEAKVRDYNLYDCEFISCGRVFVHFFVDETIRSKRP